MNIVTIEDIKRNSRIENDDEDSLLAELKETSEALIESALHRTWWEVEAAYGKIPAPLKRAVLMLCDHLYQHRGVVEAINMSVVPYGINAMVKPYIILK